MERLPRLSALLLLGALASTQLQATEEVVSWKTVLEAGAPAIYPAQKNNEPGVKAVYYENVPWKGKETRVFAYYGLPDLPPGTKAPGVVLVHGGLGSAFAEWVRWWNHRGFAAIAIDHCGNEPIQLPLADPAMTSDPYKIGRPRQRWGGPAGDGGLSQVEEPPQDQWAYQAVSAIIRAHSLLASFPEVDASAIGICGVSWGGYLTGIAAGVDDRSRFAISIYGSAFVGEDGVWPPYLYQLPASQQTRWKQLWDPSHYLPRARMPMLWINGTNDPAFSLGLWNRTPTLAVGLQTRLLKVGLPHDQRTGGELPEVVAFASAAIGAAPALPMVSEIRAHGATLSCNVTSPQPPEKASLFYTLDKGEWRQRKWQSAAATLLGGSVSAPLPKGTQACFINVTDQRGLTTSSPLYPSPAQLQE